MNKVSRHSYSFYLADDTYALLPGLTAKLFGADEDTSVSRTVDCALRLCASLVEVLDDLPLPANIKNISSHVSPVDLYSIKAVALGGNKH